MSNNLTCSFCGEEFDPEKTKPLSMDNDDAVEYHLQFTDVKFCSHNCKQNFLHNKKKDW